MGNTDNYIQIMTESLIMKKSVLEKLVVLNDEQKALIGAEDFDGSAFQDNIDKKSALVDEINRLDNGFDELFCRVRETLEADKENYSQEITRFKSLIRDVTELSVKVEAGEARNRKLVDERFAELKKGVQSAKRSSQMANTYYQNMNKLDDAPQFMDQKK